MLISGAGRCGPACASRASSRLSLARTPGPAPRSGAALMKFIAGFGSYALGQVSIARYCRALALLAES